MIQKIREQQIIDHLQKNKSATIKELAVLLHSSESSIRRDIEKLENNGLAYRVHGGVILSQYRNSVVPLSLRDTENHAAKEKIAQAAAKLVHDG